MNLNPLNFHAGCDQSKHICVSEAQQEWGCFPWFIWSVVVWSWIHSIQVVISSYRVLSWFYLSLLFVYQRWKCVQNYTLWKSVVTNAANECPQCLWSIRTDCTQQLGSAWGRRYKSLNPFKGKPTTSSATAFSSAAETNSLCFKACNCNKEPESSQSM